MPDETTTPDLDPKECKVDSDCPTGQECVDGKCKPKNTTGPVVNPPIPPQ